MNPTQSKLPWRLSEKAFEKHRTIIASAIAASPLPLAVTDIQGSVAAYESRLRDAVTAYAKYGESWPVSFSREKFLALHSSGLLKVGNKDGVVWIGTKPKDQPKESKVGFEIDSAVPMAVDLGTFMVSELTIICRLASMRLLTSPVKVSGLDQPTLEYLEGNWDVSITDNKDGSFTIL